MILILSEYSDATTWKVCDWLKHYGMDYLVITNEDIITELVAKTDLSFSFNCKGRRIDSKEITGFWYRRGDLMLSPNIRLENKGDGNQFLNQYFRRERQTLIAYLHYALSGLTNTIGSSINAGMNKLQVLHLAREYGLETPDTLITTSKLELECFLKKHNDSIITKAISEFFFLKLEDDPSHLGGLYTNKINQLTVSQMPETFFPTKFQAMVE